jgi:hypothetical protein
MLACSVVRETVLAKWDFTVPSSPSSSHSHARTARIARDDIESAKIIGSKHSLSYFF